MEVKKATPTKPGGKTQGAYIDVEEYPKDSNNIADNQTFEGENSFISISENSSIDYRMKFSINMGLLPSWLQITAKEHAESYSTPVELWTMAFLCGISAAAGKKARLLSGNYTNYPQLWVSIIGAPGTGKSDPFRVAFEPVQRINEREYAKYQSDKQEWEANEKQGKKPVWRQMIVSDTTTEALFPALSHSDGLTLYMDELSGWIGNMGRYNRGSDEPFFLMIYNNQTVTINRKMDDPQLIRDPFLNICGTIQPKILGNLLSRNNGDDSGFSQRFLYLYPEFQPKKYEPGAKRPSTAVYTSVIENIAGYTGEDDYSLSAEAEKEYERFFNDCEEKKYQKSDDFWAGVYSKAQIQVLRIALTVKVARLPEDPSTELTFDDMAAAASIVEYSINSLKKFKGEQGDKKGGKPTKADLIQLIFSENPGANQTQVGEVLGTSREHVNRTLRRSQVTGHNEGNPFAGEESVKNGV